LRLRRGQLLTTATLLYNSLEGLGSLARGVLAGSVALLGFGVGSFIEVLATVAALIMVPLIAWDGRQALHGRRACADCAPIEAAH
jgi:divalent metal cation (Fe/Co/Zn/Cd) transporter